MKYVQIHRAQGVIHDPFIIVLAFVFAGLCYQSDVVRRTRMLSDKCRLSLSWGARRWSILSTTTTIAFSRKFNFRLSSAYYRSDTRARREKEPRVSRYIYNLTVYFDFAFEYPTYGKLYTCTYIFMRSRLHYFLIGM